MKKILIFVAIFVSSQLLQAENNVTSTPITKINRIFAYTGLIVVEIANSTTNSDSCTHGSAGTFLGLPTGTTYGKEIYSAIMTAYTTDGKVRFGHSGCTEWGGSIPKIFRIEMRK